MQNPDNVSLDPRAFENTEEGSGNFGYWGLDDAKLPCYHYTMNQLNNPAAFYVNSERIERRDHWHQIGNRHVSGLVSNDGVVQLYLADRGGVFLNRFGAYTIEAPRTLLEVFFALVRIIVQVYGRLRAAWIDFRMRELMVLRGATGEQQPTPKPDPDADMMQRAYSGGFGYLDDDEQVWATAYRYGPSKNNTRRVFGMGYFETEQIHRDIRYTRRVYAPNDTDAAHDYSEDPLLLVDVEIENQRKEAVELRYYEYWDVNMHQMQVEWVRTGLSAGFGNQNRFLINKRFKPCIEWLQDKSVLRFWQTALSKDPLSDESDGQIDRTPPEIFLASLSTKPDAVYVDQEAFFGKGDARVPDSVLKRLPGQKEVPQQTTSMPYCMVLRHNLHLEPGAKVTLRFAFGAALQPGGSFDVLKYYADGDWFARSRETWKNKVSGFTNGVDPIYQRETAWHSYYLLSSYLYSEYYHTHYAPQGSAYLYLHGADGVPRDQSLFTLASIYVDPAQARELLMLLMELQKSGTLALPYGFVGNGCQSDAIVHTRPSDLDLFFMWAMSEYLSATGELDFLKKEVDFYPRGSRPTQVPGITVLDHIRAAFYHLSQVVGTGKDGLLRIGSGDWDDGVVIQTEVNTKGLISRTNSMANGESVPNSQMALYVLPLMASVIRDSDLELAKQMLQFSGKLELPVKAQWKMDSKWYRRAVLKDVLNNDYVLGDKSINLQSQPWALISGHAKRMGWEDDLIKSVSSILDVDGSPTGAMVAEGDLIWPAVSQLLTWGYMRSKPELAWRSLRRHTFATHATTFPNVWFNIWSGPDATNSKLSPAYPGGTWCSPVTPMTDFPIMNNNQHALWLLGLVRACGIEPSNNGDGLVIAPQTPGDRYVLDTKLLYLDVAPGRISGKYFAQTSGKRILHIRLPGGAAQVAANIEGRAQDGYAKETGEIPLTLALVEGKPTSFEVTWTTQ